MMKKTIAILLSLVMILGLAACGNSASQTEQPSTEDTSVESKADTNSAEKILIFRTGTTVEHPFIICQSIGTEQIGDIVSCKMNPVNLRLVFGIVFIFLGFSWAV